MTKMLIIGPAGSGKGTQAERISRHLGVVAISTGDIFRVNVKGKTPLVSRSNDTWTQGTSFRITNKMVRNRLSEADTENGFLLDGYPALLPKLTIWTTFWPAVARSST